MKARLPMSPTREHNPQKQAIVLFMPSSALSLHISKDCFILLIMKVSGIVSQVIKHAQGASSLKCNPSVKIAPSILAANLANLAPQLSALHNAGITRLHIDVMDGHFVPNLSFGPSLLSALSKENDFFYDVHLMVSGTVLEIDPYVKAGAHSITFHREAVINPKPLIDAIKQSGCQVGLALKPETSLSQITDYLHELDVLLIMTVAPGFGGQCFQPSQINKILEARQYITASGLSCKISVDGGITPETAKQCHEAGAEIFVAGTAVFGNGDPAEITHNLARFQTTLEMYGPKNV